jgi:small subunit ribosomal protein S20
LHNRAVKRTLKETIKDILDVAQANKPDDLKKAINLANKKLDKAAAKRVIHPNLAARKKGQLARLLNKKAAAPAAAKK